MKQSNRSSRGATIPVFLISMLAVLGVVMGGERWFRQACQNMPPLRRERESEHLEELHLRQQACTFAYHLPPTVTASATATSTPEPTSTPIPSPTPDARLRDTSLSSVTIRDGDRAYTARGGITGTQITLPNAVTTIVVQAVARSSAAEVQGNGSYRLTVLANTIPITVTAPDKTVGIYIVTVTRLPSSDAALESITGSNTLTPKFDPKVTAYAVTVSNTVTIAVLPSSTDFQVPLSAANPITLLVKPHEPHATIRPVIQNLKTGPNVVTVAVTAQDSTTVQLYTVTMTRELSNDATLNDLNPSLGTLKPSFDTTIYSYSVNVPSSVVSASVAASVTGSQQPVQSIITLTARPNDPLAAMMTTNVSLTNGLNTILITVTAQAGNQQTYKVTVNRELSLDATLHALDVGDAVLRPTFVSTTFEYSMTSPLTDLTITPTTTDSSATTRVTVNGKECPTNNCVLSRNTKKANVITIEVTAADGTKRTYQLTIAPTSTKGTTAQTTRQ